MTYDELHQVCRKRGYVRKDPRQVLKTLLSRIDATDRKRARDVAHVRDASGDSPEVRGSRRRVDDLHSAFGVGKKIVKERAQWWDPRMKEKWDAKSASSLE